MAVGGTVRLVVAGAADVDTDELETLTAQLRRRLLELDVDDVRLARSDGPVPDGAKPGELLSVGVLAVTLAPAVIRPVLRLVEAWMTSRPVRTVTVEWDGRTLELGAATPEQQERLLTAFLEGGRAPSDVSSATSEEPPARDQRA
ncbi:hypothetical protein SAMN05216223_11076 [Actinacidiphila yanglinensis]|uniref:Uncharacterized protein n=1 Tax=Actinacidiphila yanglinensis TaxID=310779 RepID=A0A1H6CTE5_9ACTN|nr:hypothetical protein SAMN05216223_11076 [Actinacidiphila yanglinensis]